VGTNKGARQKGKARRGEKVENDEYGRKQIRHEPGKVDHKGEGRGRRTPGTRENEKKKTQTRTYHEEARGSRTKKWVASGI